MCLRKLAGVMPLLVAMSMGWAQVTAAPVTVAALDMSSKVGGPVGSPMRDGFAARSAVATTATTAPQPRVAVPTPQEPNAPRDLKGLTAVIGGLALVGWFQRRRSGSR